LSCKEGIPWYDWLFISDIISKKTSEGHETRQQLKGTSIPLLYCFYAAVMHNYKYSSTAKIFFAKPFHSTTEIESNIFAKISL